MPLSIPLGSFRNFLEICGDIRSSRCTTGVVDTGGKWKKSSIIKVLIILFGHLWEVELTYRYIFAFKFTLRSQQPDIVPIICYRCHWHRWQICCRGHWYRWQIASGVIDTAGKFAAGIVDTGGKFATGATTLVKLAAKFDIAAGVVDTSGKFATGVVDTGGAPWLANISSEFSKNFETVLMGYSEAGGKLIQEKTSSKKSRDTVPLN